MLCSFAYEDLIGTHALSLSLLLTDSWSLNRRNYGYRHLTNAQERFVKGRHGIGINVHRIVLQSPKPVNVSSGAESIIPGSLQDNGVDIERILSVDMRS